MPSRASTRHAIGAVFTPSNWVRWVLLEYGVYSCWLQGASIFDPTAGDGSFLEGLVALAIEQGVPVSTEMLRRLWANEPQAVFIDTFMNRLRDRYGLEFPRSNFFNEDIFWFQPSLQVDILVGNPPWQNFVDLPPSYKEKIKPLFLEYNLIGDRKQLLLGSSRIDLAALAIVKTLRENLRDNGEAYFFLPLSLLLNDGAATGFRSYGVNGIPFEIREIRDFAAQKIFVNVSTRYGFASFQRDRRQQFPIPYFTLESNSFSQLQVQQQLQQQPDQQPDQQTDQHAEQQKPHHWQHYQAAPLFLNSDPLVVTADRCGWLALQQRDRPVLPARRKPRQGANTCGAKEVFVFERWEAIDDRQAIVGNRSIPKVSLPRQFLFPLLATANFVEDAPQPQRYLLLPYDRTTGKALTLAELENYPELLEYLRSQRSILEKRRGSLIQNAVRKGCWWSLLGVGAYAFAPYKVFWQAYGQATFQVRMMEGCWQGNQALHAFIPCNAQEEAEQLLAFLQQAFVEEYLQSQRMQGTCNWAQPGRMSRLFRIE